MEGCARPPVGVTRAAGRPGRPAEGSAAAAAPSAWPVAAGGFAGPRARRPARRPCARGCLGSRLRGSAAGSAVPRAGLRRGTGLLALRGGTGLGCEQLKFGNTAKCHAWDLPEASDSREPRIQESILQQSGAARIWALYPSSCPCSFGSIFC